jgi:L-ribulose-5-phosphate 3-epimerase
MSSLKSPFSSRQIARRQFVVGATAALALASASVRATAAEDGIEHTAPPRRLLKTLKIGMVKVPGDLTAKFKAVKAAGYEGIELDTPGIDVPAVRAACEASGLVVDGSVCATHWNIRHSSPDANERAQALVDLKAALQQTKAVGGHTVLLVVGHGKDGTPEEVWSRSTENIRQALPLCAELGMTIAIENVWNEFLYDHSGGNDQTADSFVKYVDQFDSPWVGMQFDIGNHWKYGNPADWIRTLGRRVVKLDIKGFSRASNDWADITEDDLPWADVRRALDEINFDGWVAAEVSGGDAARLQKIAAQIDRALNIG